MRLHHHMLLAFAFSAVASTRCGSAAAVVLGEVFPSNRAAMGRRIGASVVERMRAGDPRLAVGH